MANLMHYQIYYSKKNKLYKQFCQATNPVQRVNLLL